MGYKNIEIHVYEDKGGELQGSLEMVFNLDEIKANRNKLF